MLISRGFQTCANNLFCEQRYFLDPPTSQKNDTFSHNIIILCKQSDWTKIVITSIRIEPCNNSSGSSPCPQHAPNPFSRPLDHRRTPTALRCLSGCMRCSAPSHRRPLFDQRAASSWHRWCNGQRRQCPRCDGPRHVGGNHREGLPRRCRQKRRLRKISRVVFSPWDEHEKSWNKQLRVRS